MLTSKFWKPSFEARRCIVPASSYCEPNGQSPATWYWFALNGDDERPLFAFPGIWQRWKGPVKKDGPNVEIDTYAFMTTEPNALTRSINHERMPVLLSGEDQFETWLSGSPQEAFALARSFDPALMRIVQSGTTKRICWRPDWSPCVAVRATGIVQNRKLRPYHAATAANLLLHQTSPHAPVFLLRNRARCFQTVEFFNLVSSTIAHDLT